MNILDIIIIIPVIWFAYRGYCVGLILSVTSLVALIAGIYLSIHFSGFVTQFLRMELGWEGQYLPILSFLLTFISVVIVIQIIGRLFNQVADWAALGFVNKLAGLILGVAKAVLFLGILILILNTFEINNKVLNDKNRTESYFYEPLSRIIPGIWPVVKEWLPSGSEESEDQEYDIVV